MQVGDLRVDLGDGNNAETNTKAYQEILESEFGLPANGVIKMGKDLEQREICLVAHKRGLPNLTLVDLPGIPRDGDTKNDVVKALDAYVASPNNIVLMVEWATSEGGRLHEWAKTCKGRGLIVVNCFDSTAPAATIGHMRDWEGNLGHQAHVVSSVFCFGTILDNDELNDVVRFHLGQNAICWCHLYMRHYEQCQQSSGSIMS